MPVRTAIDEIPAEIIDRFRARAVERIELLEGAGDPQRQGEPPLRFLAAGAATRRVVERICPTGDDQPAEVVLIDGVEAVLLRPAHMTPSALMQ